MKAETLFRRTVYRVATHAIQGAPSGVIETVVPLNVLDVEHHDDVTRRQLRGLGVARGPGAHDEATTHRVRAELVHDPTHLIVVATYKRVRTAIKLRIRAFFCVMHREPAPEIAVRARHRPVLVRPRIPELAPVLLEQVDLGLPAQEPQVLHDDVLPAHLLRREKREPFRQVDLVVDVERRQSVDARSILFSSPRVEDLPDGLQVLPHDTSPFSVFNAARHSARAQ
jgi:hypothetical protein